MSNDTFASFKCAFKGDLVTPTDPDYTSAIARWARNAQMSAGVVAFVKNEEDVALALAYARRNKLQIAVRGGGFSTQGASSTDGGVVIDLSRYLNGVRVEPDNKLVFCGGGAIWETVDKAAIRHGLATVGSTVNQVGPISLSCCSGALISDRSVWEGMFASRSPAIRVLTSSMHSALSLAAVLGG
jgi:FAD/FMN-containing dehydrogenase